MFKTSVFTTITPLPAEVTRQTVFDTYRNHVEMIDLNPMVVDRFPCEPPRYAPAEELKATWYTVKDKVNYLPGGRISGSVSYHACFYDLPDGLQTHVYAPLGLEIRAKWSVGGSQPGEAKAPVELGIDAPREGLYIREDVRMKCNIMMMSFVKKAFKDSHAILVDRLADKAHLINAEMANADPMERMAYDMALYAPPPGYHRPQKVLSNGSVRSQNSSTSSRYLSSPPHVYTQQPSPPLPPHPQEAFDHRSPLSSGINHLPNTASRQLSQPQQETALAQLPYRTTTLPATTLNASFLPSTFNLQQPAQPSYAEAVHTYQPAPALAELPCTDPPLASAELPCTDSPPLRQSCSAELSA